EDHPEQAAGCAECRLNHVVEHEIWLRFSLVEIVLGLTDLLGVVPPVPWLDRLVETFGARHCLHRPPLPPPPGPGPLPQPPPPAPPVPWPWPAPRPATAAARRPR